MFSEQQKEFLSEKLDARHVKQRDQGGRKLSYIEGWQAISEANRIFGFDGWSRETADIRQAHEPYQNANGNWVVGYVAKVRITVGEITRDGSGFGSGIDKDLGRAHESALKESETDSMKRALMTFGNQFGLALYDKTQEGVERSGASPQSLGGQARAASMTPDRRSEVARNAAAARWQGDPPAETTVNKTGVLTPADKLMLHLSTAKSATDLNEMKSGAAFKAQYKALAKPDQDRVADHGRQVSEKFTPTQMAG